MDTPGSALMSPGLLRVRPSPVALRRSQPLMFQDIRHFAQQLASMACLPAP